MQRLAGRGAYQPLAGRSGVLAGLKGILSGPGNQGGFFPIPGLGNLNDGVYTDFTKGSLTGDRGGTWSLTRATATTGVDLNGLVYDVSSGAPRWWRIGASSGAVGISVFGAHTNILLHNRDLTNAAWVKGATATVAKDQTGADGTANGASRITGGAVTATNAVLQTVVSASAARYATAWVKRVTGTGTIEMTTDGGTTWVNVTSQISATYAQITIPVQTVTNPVTGFRITTSTDAIAVDYVMNTGVAAAPAIATTTAAVTVNADVYTLSGSGIINATEGTLYLEALIGAVANARGLSIDDGTSNELVEIQNGTIVVTGDTVSANIVDGGVNQAGLASGATGFAGGAAGKIAVRYKANDFALSFDGAAAITDTSGTTPAATTFRLSRFNGGNQWSGVIKRVAYARTGASDANLAVATTP